MVLNGMVKRGQESEGKAEHVVSQFSKGIAWDCTAIQGNGLVWH